MHEADLVCSVERRGDLLDDLHRPRLIQRAVGQDVLEVVALDQPHIDIQPSLDLAEVVDRDDVGVIQACRGECLVPKPLLEHRICGQLRR